MRQGVASYQRVSLEGVEEEEEGDGHEEVGEFLRGRGGGAEGTEEGPEDMDGDLLLVVGGSHLGQG